MSSHDLVSEKRASAGDFIVGGGAKSASRPGRGQDPRASSSTRVSPRHGTSAIAFLDPLPCAERGSVGVLPAFLGAWAKSAFPRRRKPGHVGEATAATSFAVLLVKFLRCDTLDGWIADVFAYGKSSLAVLASPPTPRAASSRGLIVCLVLWVFVPVPVASAMAGPRGPNAPAAFAAEVQKSEWNKDDRDVTWIVMFHADWSPAAAHFAPAFAHTSVEYSGPKLRFATVDVGRFPATAERLGIQLDASGPASCIPSVLMFERGEELARLPKTYLEGTRVKGSRMRMRDLVAGFELEKRREKDAPSKGGRAKKRD